MKTKIIEDILYEISYIYRCKIRYQFKRVKWAYQRVVRGYDDTIEWDFFDYIEDFLPALKNICSRNLAETFTYGGKSKENVFKKTLVHIENFELANLKFDYMETGEEYVERLKELEDERSKMWSFIGNNIGYYWD